MKPRSMRARLTLAFATAIVSFMALLSIAVVGYTRQLESNQLAHTLEEQARRYRSEWSAKKAVPDDWNAFLLDENRKLKGLNLTLLVYDTSGFLVGRTRSTGRIWPRNGDWLTETVNIKGYSLMLAAPWHSPSIELRELALKLGAMSLLVVVATAMGSWVLVGRVLSPIEGLAHQAAAASTDELRVRLESPSADLEVMGLVRTLNQMLASLAQTTEAKERFYAAASHELRTPLQGMSSLLEYGLSRTRSAQEWQDIAVDAYGQSRRLCELTTDLLALNQLEMATSKPPAAEVDAGDLIERHLSTLRPQAEAKRLKIQWNLAEDAEIIAPWNHLEMLVRNLLENAVKYAEVDGQVNVIWRQNDTGEAHFSVWNTADLPQEFDAVKLCEPFYRMDAARRAGSGNGLGLAICLAICRANEWTLELLPQGDGLLASVVIGAPGREA